MRAMWRDTVTLWQEFRVPILVFFLITFVGGYFYGELHRLSGLQPEIAVIDRPYTMVQLMILESPAEYAGTPSQWYLIIWWYLLPPIFVFIVGNGVIEFVHLFFDRSHRRDAWREAVASTYRQHVIVLGAGHVGLRVVRVLHDMMHVDVVVIDYKPDPGVEEFLAKRNVPLLRGDGSQSSTLEKAGLKYAEAFVACTGDDHTNLDAIMRARAMNSGIRIVARVWDNQFANQIKDFMRVQSVLSSSELSAPIFAGLALGVEITQSLQIGGIDYSTMRLTVNEGSFMDGAMVGDLQDENDIDVVLHVAKGQAPNIKPSGNVSVRAEDTLVIFAQHEKSLEIAARNKYLR